MQVTDRKFTNHIAKTDLAIKYRLFKLNATNRFSLTIKLITCFHYFVSPHIPYYKRKKVVSLNNHKKKKKVWKIGFFLYKREFTAEFRLTFSLINKLS